MPRLNPLLSGSGNAKFPHLFQSRDSTMKKFAFAALAAATLVLGACGGSSNSNCKDEQSTMAYAQKWSEDLSKAAASGKIDPAKAAEASQELMKDQAELSKDMGAFCNKLDELRKKIGF